MNIRNGPLGAGNQLDSLSSPGESCWMYGVSPCEPLRHPSQPGLSLASCQLIHTAITAGTSRVAYGPLCLHAVADTPAGLMELVRSYRSTNFGLPTNRGGSAPALSVSGPAQRSLTLRPARSPSRLATLWVERTSSRAGLPPLWTTAFSRRTRLSDQDLVTYSGSVFSLDVRRDWVRRCVHGKSTV
jgi:hypothetical protein